MKKQIEDLIKRIVHCKFRYINVENDRQFRENGIGYEGDFFSSINDPEIVIKQENNKDYFPLAIFDYDFKSLLKSGKDLGGYGNSSDYKRYIQKIDDNIDIIIELHGGGISGVGYGQGWEIRVGLNYYNAMIMLYHYKHSINSYNQEHFDVKMVNEFDFFKSLKIKDFKLDDDYTKYLSEYNMVTFDDTTNWNEIHKFAVEDGTFYYMDSFYHLGLRLTGAVEKNPVPKDLLVQLKVKKVVFKTHNVHSFDFIIPNDFESVEFSLEKNKNPNDSWDKSTNKSKTNRIIANCPSIRPYIPDTYKKTAKKITQTQFDANLECQEIILDFNYKNLSGKVLTNKFQYEFFKEFYSKDSVALNVAGFNLKLTKKEFFKSIKIVESPKKKIVKSISELGQKIGFTDWWLTEFEKRPDYSYDS